MSDLIEFLRAQLDEDEALVQLYLEPGRPFGYWVGDIHDDEGAQLEDLYEERFADPARVLREVEAKRRILDEHADLDCASLEPDSWARSFVACRRCRDVLLDRRIVAPCPTLRLLALPYSDHPDYDPSWSVDL